MPAAVSHKPMGGRSKEGHQLTDRWKWIAELSEERLNNYGKYSAIESEQHRAAGLSDSQSALVRGREGSASTLNFQLSEYYKSKYGVEPEWSNWRST